MVVNTHLEHGDKCPSSCVEDEVPEKYLEKYTEKAVDAVIGMGKDGEGNRVISAHVDSAISSSPLICDCFRLSINHLTTNSILAHLAL
jgi:hypothetical protein